MANIFALKGNILYSNAQMQLVSAPNSYLIAENGVSLGVFSRLPQQYQNIPVADYGDKLILPGMTDLHLHAPQYANCGLGLDLELLDWLERYTFREEAKFADLAYAEAAYNLFCTDLRQSVTTRACVFGTLHKEATLLLMEKMQQTGLIAYVGKVNMDVNCPDFLREPSADLATADTADWLRLTEERQFSRIRPILTPRFVPSCSAELLQKLAVLQKQGQLPVQSHLSENLAEVAWVRQLFPQTSGYADVYRRFDLLGDTVPTIMAHCLYLQPAEKELLQQRQVFIAHCPASNTNLSSGVAPAREFLELGIPMGLGSDISGGQKLSLLDVMSQAISASKLRWRLLDAQLAPLTIAEAFYLATRGGGAFFGKVGSLEAGFALDAVVMDDSRLAVVEPLTPEKRLEKLIFLGDNREVFAKYVAGKQLF